MAKYTDDEIKVVKYRLQKGVRNMLMHIYKFMMHYLVTKIDLKNLIWILTGSVHIFFPSKRMTII